MSFEDTGKARYQAKLTIRNIMRGHLREVTRRQCLAYC